MWVSELPHAQSREKHAKPLSLPEMKAVHQLCYYYNHLSQVKSAERPGDRKWRDSEELEPPRREPSQGAASPTHLLSLARKSSGSHSPVTGNRGLSFPLDHPAAATSLGLKRGREDKEHETALRGPQSSCSWGSGSRTLLGREGQLSRNQDQLPHEPFSSPSSVWAKAGCEGGAAPAMERARLRWGSCTRWLFAWSENQEVGQEWDLVEVISRIGRWTPPHPPLKERKTGWREGGLLKCSLPR